MAGGGVLERGRPATAYETLGVDVDADERELRRAYRDAIRRWHPDRDPSPEAARRFLAAQRAWELLADPDDRAAYDARLRAAGGEVVFAHRPSLWTRLAQLANLLTGQSGGRGRPGEGGRTLR